MREWHLLPFQHTPYVQETPLHRRTLLFSIAPDIMEWFQSIKPKLSCIIHLQPMEETRVHRWPSDIATGAELERLRAVNAPLCGMKVHPNKVSHINTISIFTLTIVVALAKFLSGPPGGRTLPQTPTRLSDLVGGVYGPGASVASTGLNTQRPAIKAGLARDAGETWEDVLEYYLVSAPSKHFQHK
jgi:hypothetical protein